MARDSDRERTQGGKFSTEITLEEILSVVERSPHPSVMTGEVADELDISDESARQKLLALTENGQIEQRKAGRQTLWWVNRERPAVVDVTHEFYSGEASAAFSNGVVLTVSHTNLDEMTGFSAELTHPDREPTRVMRDEGIERPPGEILVEFLADYYNEEDERGVKVPGFDQVMDSVGDNLDEEPNGGIEALLDELDEEDEEAPSIEAELDELDETETEAEAEADRLLGEEGSDDE